MPTKESGLQTFLRIANLFGPGQDDTNAYAGMPSELPTRPGVAQPLINRGRPSISAPGAYGYEGPSYNEEMTGAGQPEMATLEAFRRNVLNPPKRTRMTYPKNILAGLDAALKIAAEPSPTERNRVYIGGKAYQKQQVYTDPTTGEKKFMTNVKDPSFMSQVMRAMPAAISPAVDILNQRREDEVGDWELQNKALKEAVGAESQMALAQQRSAQAGAIPERVRQGQERIDISRMTAEERVRVSQLNTLTDEQKLQMLQAGRISLAELQAAESMKRLERGGEIRSGQIAQQGAITSGQIERRGGIARDIARIRGEEARKTKAASGATGGASVADYPTQQRVAMQAKAAQIANQNPEWAEHISINEEGFPEIEAPTWYGGPDKATYDKIYEAIYGTSRVTPITPTPTAKPTAPAAKPPPKAPPTKQAASVPVGTKQYSASRNQTRIMQVNGTWKIVQGRQ